MIFIVGSSRSGTTMLGRILNQHPTIFTFNELHFFEHLCSSEELDSRLPESEAIKLADRLIGTQKEGFLQYSCQMKYESEAKRLLSRCEDDLLPYKVFRVFIETFVQNESAEIGCDQTPRNVLYIHEILDFYKDAKVICMVRDPRSVLLSQKRKWKRKFLGANEIPLKETVRSYFNYHPYTITKLWLAALKNIDRHRKSNRVTVIVYETLINNPATEIRKLCEFLNVTYKDNMLDIPRVGSSNIHDHDWKEKGIASGSDVKLQRDGLNKGEIYICEKVADKMMEKYGYTSSANEELPVISIFKYIILFPLHITVSLLFNLGRSKNIRQSIMRRL